MAHHSPIIRPMLRSDPAGEVEGKASLMELEDEVEVELKVKIEKHVRSGDRA